MCNRALQLLPLYLREPHRRMQRTLPRCWPAAATSRVPFYHTSCPPKLTRNGCQLKACTSACPTLINPPPAPPTHTPRSSSRYSHMPLAAPTWPPGQHPSRMSPTEKAGLRWSALLMATANRGSTLYWHTKPSRMGTGLAAHCSGWGGVGWGAGWGAGWGGGAAQYGQHAVLHKAKQDGTRLAAHCSGWGSAAWQSVPLRVLWLQSDKGGSHPCPLWQQQQCGASHPMQSFPHNPLHCAVLRSSTATPHPPLGGNPCSHHNPPLPPNQRHSSSHRQPTLRYKRRPLQPLSPPKPTHPPTSPTPTPPPTHTHIQYTPHAPSAANLLEVLCGQAQPHCKHEHLDAQLEPRRGDPGQGGGVVKGGSRRDQRLRCEVERQAEKKRGVQG